MEPQIGWQTVIAFRAATLLVVSVIFGPFVAQLAVSSTPP
jgi:hypothetical protein